MESLSALAAGGTDQHDVSGGTVAALGLHLGDSMLDQTKNAVEIDGQRGAPLFVRHAFDRDVVRGPHAMAGAEDVEASKVLDGLIYERPSRFRLIEIGRDR